MKTLSAVAAMAALFAFPVMAQPSQQCPTLDILRAFLTEQHGEHVIFWGVRGGGTVFQVWANPDTLTWTLFETDGDHACIRDAGEGFSLAKVQSRPNL